METAIRLYTSDQHAARAFARVLAENLSQPVELHLLSALPVPSAQRPTRQLRLERASLQVELAAGATLLRLATPYPSLAADVALLHAQQRQRTERLEQIARLLSEAPA